ncbi:MAG: putative Ig domain-containing protein [Candidatus Accumulibacter sp.]|jgi:uncharacterized delta-60 repeat protein|nr:putative Ig domain-containing protein [Accumulibacter sp.]
MPEVAARVLRFRLRPRENQPCRTSFARGSSEYIKSVSIQSDGKILAAGYGSTDGATDFVLQRYNSNGSLDASFNGDGMIIVDAGGNESARSVTTEPGGKILVLSTGSSGSFLLRYLSDGSLDVDFGVSGRVETQLYSWDTAANSVTLQPDGKILVAGARSGEGTDLDFALVRYNSDGSLDVGFGDNGYVTTPVSNSAGAGCSVKVQGDGKIIVAGGQYNPGGSGSDLVLVRYDQDGTPDPSFVGGFLPDHVAFKHDAVNITIPDGLFVDPDSGDRLTFSATQAGGSALPSWLSFDAATRTFSGTPGDGDVGRFGVVITATDEGGLSASRKAFTLTILKGNTTPTGDVTITGTAAQNQLLTASNTLDDVDGLGSIAYQWESSPNGTTWSVLSGATGDSFTLTQAQVGQHLRVVASYIDGLGTAESRASEATPAIANANDAPVVASPISDQGATEATAFSVTIPAGTFTDVDAGDVLTYAATLANGSALPAWLTFDAATRTFQGTPTTVGTVSVRLTASDSGGLTASDVFDIMIASINKTLTGTASADTLTGGIGNDTLSGLGGNDVLDGLGGNDSLDGGGGTDTLVGGAGNDTYVVDNAGDVVTENAGEGTDLVRTSVTYTLSANVENLTLTGTAAISATGNTLDNVLTGNSGVNVLDGGSGTDALVGGTGNDTYVVDNSDDVVTENSGAGTDLVQSSATYTLSTNVENLTLTGTSAINATGNTLNNTLTGNTADNVLDGGAGSDTLVGGAGNDTYYVSTGDTATEVASAGTDTVISDVTWTLGSNLENLTLTGTSAINGTGNTLSNVLAGNSGANVLDGGTGADTLVGAAGNDTYMVDNVADVVTENTGEGSDLVRSSVTHTLSANVENLTLTGTSAINATGNTLTNVLTGNSGANVLDGGSGSDTLIGGAGNDTYVLDNSGDVITENAGEGTDLVQASLTSTLSANLENLTLTGTSAINATGNALNNTLTGNIADNVLDGKAGSDTLVGGLGNDTYYVSTGDTVTEAASAGTDTVISDVTWTLGSNLEDLTLTGATTINGTGNTLNNVLTGNTADNLLNGATGTDTLIGGLGNDGYTVDNAADVVIENTGEGTDLVQASLTWTLSANLENLTLTGGSAINGTGNSLDNVLTGNSAANALAGGDGNDTLSGAAGADSLVGGLGNDTYVVDHSGDVITENTGEGADQVQSSVTYTLAANVDNLTLTGTSGINGTGNTLNNVLTGNAGNNILNGGTGADTLIGGLGNDTYAVDNAADGITENTGEGTDLVQASLTWILSANLENLTLSGASAINGTGNSLDNVLTGNGAANTLSGGFGNDTLSGAAGADTLVGGLGNDTYVVDNSGDVITENTGEGTDLVQSSVTWTLAANVDNLTLAGSTAINGTGNSLDNVLTGNTGNNTLTGGLGNDTLAGGTGSDRLDGGAGNDTYLFARGDGADVAGDNDATADNSDLAQFAAGIANDQLWFRHVGNNLEVSVIGTGDALTIENWYTGSACHVERFQTADNKLLIDSNVENLVQAMAAFAPPSAGQTTLPPAYQTALAPILAANWQ